MLQSQRDHLLGVVPPAGPLFPLLTASWIVLCVLLSVQVDGKLFR